MSAYDVMDDFLRTSLVEETFVEETFVESDNSLSDFQAELSLIEEGDPFLLGLWYAATGRSAIFEDEDPASWLVEREARDPDEIDRDIAKHEKALANVKKDPDQEFFTFKRLKKLEPGEKRKEGDEGEEVRRSRADHIQSLEQRLRGLHRERKGLGTPSIIPTPVGSHSVKPIQHPPARFYSPDERTSSGEGGHAEKPWAPQYVSDDPKSAEYKPFSSRGIANRGNLRAIPTPKGVEKKHGVATRKAIKKGTPLPPPLPNRVARALPGQVINRAGDPVPRFPLTLGMHHSKILPDYPPARSDSAAAEAAKKLPWTKPMFRTKSPKGAPADYVPPLKRSAAIHAIMHKIAGIKDPHNLTPIQKVSIDALVQSHGHYMGMAPHQTQRQFGKGDTTKSLTGRDYAVSAFLGTGGGQGRGQPAASPYSGIIEIARRYVNREVKGERVHADPKKPPEDANEEVRRLLIKKATWAEKQVAYRAKERKDANHEAGSLSAHADDGEEFEQQIRGGVSAALGGGGNEDYDDDDESHTSEKPGWKGAGTRGTDHLNRHQRLHRIHDVLAGHYTHEHAENLRAHFERTDAKKLVAHHTTQIDAIKARLKGATGASKTALKEELKHHRTVRAAEANRAATAHWPVHQIRDQIERLRFAIDAMKHRNRKHRSRDRSPEETAAHPHMQIMRQRLRELEARQEEVHNPAGRTDYKRYVHILHGATGGHAEYGIEMEKPKRIRKKGDEGDEGDEGEEGEKVDESISLFDALFEADEPGKKPRKPRKSAEPKSAEPKLADKITVPQSIGASPMPEKWKEKIAAYLGVDPSYVSNDIKKLFSGSDGEHLTQWVLDVGEAHRAYRPPDQKRLFVQAARKGKRSGAGGSLFAKAAYLAKHTKRAKDKLGAGWSDLAPAPDLQLTPEQKAKEARRAERDKKAGEEHRQFVASVEKPRLSPTDVEAAKRKPGQKMTKEEKAKRMADAQARRKGREDERERATQARMQAKRSGAPSDAPGDLESRDQARQKKALAKQEKADAEADEKMESYSLFGAIFTESRNRVPSLFEAVLN